MILFGALVAAEVAALALAVVHARRAPPPLRVGETSGLRVDEGGKRTAVPPPSPLVALLAFAVVGEVAGEALHVALAGAPRPFAGWHRVAYHCETGLVTAWPAALAAAAWRAFVPIFREPKAPHPRGIYRDSWPRVQNSGGLFGDLFRPARAILAAWCLALAGMIAAYPLPRGWTAPLLHAWELACVAVAGVAVVRAWARPWSRAAVAVGLLVAVELVVGVIGAWGRDVFRQWDALARLPYLLGFGALAGVQAAWLRRNG